MEMSITLHGNAFAPHPSDAIFFIPYENVIHQDAQS